MALTAQMLAFDPVQVTWLSPMDFSSVLARFGVSSPPFFLVFCCHPSVFPGFACCCQPTAGFYRAFKNYFHGVILIKKAKWKTRVGREEKTFDHEVFGICLRRMWGGQAQCNPCCKSEEKWDACWHF